MANRIAAVIIQPSETSVQHGRGHSFGEATVSRAWPRMSISKGLAESAVVAKARLVGSADRGSVGLKHGISKKSRELIVTSVRLSIAIRHRR